MKKYAVDVTRCESTTIVVEAEDEDEAIVKANEIAWHIPDRKWGSHDEYEIDIYDELDELIRMGYKVEYLDEIGYLTV